MRAYQRDYLAAQPHGAQMTQDKSIYDLGRVAFAANNVMLREHFRSDPAIIEFSNKNFYHGKIRPLRSPQRGQGVPAPLVDMRVQGGFRDARDGNPAEARAIVEEIKALIVDPLWEAKSIGIVSLLGQHQHKLISAMLAEELEPRELLRRKIKSGTPAEFQGRERDVMFVSMVIEKGDLGMSLKQDNEQRLNVAMSRARDRVYLVRSVDASDVRVESLSGRLMSHFDAPFAADFGVGGRELCESGFEVDMFDELAKRGYRVQPQFQCGGYRMDFVAIGRDGQKVAIECDGDRFHGPEQWGDDMRRQRVLERAGWVFFRCFASSFAKDRSGVMSGLEVFLKDSGVEPSAWEMSSGSSALVERRSVTPLVAAKSS
jgi:very-short-patch-repair endonuclease